MTSDDTTEHTQLIADALDSVPEITLDLLVDSAGEGSGESGDGGEIGRGSHDGPVA